mgnify:FL=1
MKKIIILSLVLVFIATGCSLNLNRKKQVKLSSDEVKTKIAGFINENLLKPGDKVEIREVTE